MAVIELRNPGAMTFPPQLQIVICLLLQPSNQGFRTFEGAKIGVVFPVCRLAAPR